MGKEKIFLLALMPFSAGSCCGALERAEISLSRRRPASLAVLILPVLSLPTAILLFPPFSGIDSLHFLIRSIPSAPHLAVPNLTDRLS
jgi:hypothetical protein